AAGVTLVSQRLADLSERAKHPSGAEHPHRSAQRFPRQLPRDRGADRRLAIQRAVDVEQHRPHPRTRMSHALAPAGVHASRLNSARTWSASLNSTSWDHTAISTAHPTITSAGRPRTIPAPRHAPVVHAP